MNRLTTAFFAAALFASGGSCTGSEDRETIRPITSEINPGTVRVVSTVVKIDSARVVRSEDPCSTYPCFATIRIDSVLGYGSGFPRPLSPGESLAARFAFTLAPSNAAMPDLAEPLPGLEEGDSFQADIRAYTTPGGDARDPTVVVHDYRTGPDSSKR